MNIEFLKDGTTLTVKPEGRLDATTSPDADLRIQAEIEGITDIILDLERVDYISSRGLRVILSWYQEMEQRGGSLKVLNVNEYIKEVFDLTGFLGFLEIE